MIGASGTTAGARRAPATAPTRSPLRPRRHRQRSARPQRPRPRWRPSPRALRRPRRRRCGARRRGSLRSPETRAGRRRIDLRIALELGFRFGFVRAGAHRLDDGDLLLLVLRFGHDPTIAVAFAGVILLGERRAGGPPGGEGASHQPTARVTGGPRDDHHRLLQADLGDQQDADDQHRGRGQRRADGADDAGPHLAQPLAEEPARTVVGDIAVGERQMQQHGDRAEEQQAPGPLAQTVDERARAEAADRSDRGCGDHQIGAEAKQRVEPRRDGAAAGTHERIAADLHRHQRHRGEEAAGEQQDAADFAAAILAVSLAGGFGGGSRLGAGGHRWVLVVRGGLTPTSDYPDRQLVKFPRFRIPPLSAARARGRP